MTEKIKMGRKYFLSLILSLAFLPISAQVFTTIGPELAYRYDLRSSVSLGCHFNFEKELRTNADGTTLSNMFMITYELRYYFSKQTLAGEDLSFKYFLYTDDASYRFWRPIGGATLSQHTNFKENSFYVIPSFGFTYCGLWDINAGYSLPFNHRTSLPQPQKLVIEFCIRPLMFQYVYNKLK